MQLNFKTTVGPRHNSGVSVPMSDNEHDAFIPVLHAGTSLDVCISSTLPLSLVTTHPHDTYQLK